MFSVTIPDKYGYTQNDYGYWPVGEPNLERRLCYGYRWQFNMVYSSGGGENKSQSTSVPLSIIIKGKK